MLGKTDEKTALAPANSCVAFKVTYSVLACPPIVSPIHAVSHFHGAFSSVEGEDLWALLSDGSTTPGYQTGTAGTGVTIANKTLRMGGVDGILDFNGALDGVQLYSVALDAARVKALYDRTFNPACVATIPRSTTNSWSRLLLAPQETRGGKVTASGSISVTIDKTRPDVSFTSVRNGLFVQVLCIYYR